MTRLDLIIAPHPIFRQVAAPVETVDDVIRADVAAMFGTLYHEQGVGLGANMVGLLKRIIVIDLQLEGKKAPLTLINPVVTSASDETQVFDEASLSFPGIFAKVTRPKSVEVDYLDQDGIARSLKAEGFLATVIQHEMDYLDGRTFLDHLSSVKRKMLMKKVEKMRRGEEKDAS
jgi:peptide deformylase